MCVCVYIYLSPYIGENIKKKKLSFQLEKPEKELNKSTKCTKKANSNEMEARMKVKVKLLSCVRLFAAPWTVAHQAPPSMEFSRQEYWSGLPFPSPGDLPDPRIEPGSPALQAGSLPSEL